MEISPSLVSTLGLSPMEHELSVIELYTAQKKKGLIFTSFRFVASLVMEADFLKLSYNLNLLSIINIFESVAWHYNFNRRRLLLQYYYKRSMWIIFFQLHYRPLNQPYADILTTFLHSHKLLRLPWTLPLDLLHFLSTGSSPEKQIWRLCHRPQRNN